jgi:dipeptidyl aminopeptidase/acylaminoacyl peptidase
MLDLRQLVRTRSAYAGRFDAGGTQLYFVSDLTGVPQVWAHAGDAWPELVVAPPDRAQDIHPGPRPGQLIVGADVGGDEHSQLLYVPELGAPYQYLTHDPSTIHTFGSFSPDGQHIAYSANTRTTRWADIFLRELSSGETRCVLEHDSTNRAVAFTPDGRWLIVRRLFSSSHQELWLADVHGSEPPRRLSDPDQDARYLGPEWSPDGQTLYVLTDVGREFAAPAKLDITTHQVSYLLDDEVEIDEATLDPTGRRLAYVRNRDGAGEVVVRTLQTGHEQRIEGLPEGGQYAYWQDALAWDRTGERLAISWTASRAAPNVWLWSEAENAAKQATRAGGMGFDPAQFVEPEHITYPTFDGRAIPALFYPSGTSTGPCVVWVHGGPEGQFQPTFNALVQYLVSAGLSVLAPNVRGSSGYGRTYAHLDDVKKRMDSVADLAHAAYWLRDSGRADPRRLAVYGGSYGGFMVLAALTTYPDLWAAGVDLVGIANFVTFLENTGPWRRHLREAEYGSLEHDREFLTEISPINHVERIKAPLLVIHGANDPRVPIGEAEQMVERLRALGRTVEFLRLEDEGHQIAKLKNKLAVFPIVAQFLRLHLIGAAAG